MNRPAIGLDVGSVTVKAVATDAAGAVAWRHYVRHRSRQGETVKDLLAKMQAECGIAPGGAEVFVTGSGATPVVEPLGAHFVHEVNAVALAVETECPGARSVIELGGQDAKILLFQADPATGKRRRFTSMNDKCAGGTGSVIDRVAAKIGLTIEHLTQLPHEEVPIHPVAGKCGVFAETDINSLKNMGVPPEQLVASLYDAIVIQNLTVLARGNTLWPKVVLLGGPHAHLPGLAVAWRRQIRRLWQERGVPLPNDVAPEALVFVPPDAEYFAALGALEFGRREFRSAVRTSRVAGARPRVSAQSAPPVPSGSGLRGSEEEFLRFLGRYGQSGAVPRPPTAAGPVEVFLGLDGGSTTVKAVLTDAAGAVLATSYRQAKDNPIEDARTVLLSLRAELGDADVRVLGTGVTGYAKDVLKDVIGADVAVVETVAHAKSALAMAPGTDVICDVGGQDIKILMLRDGRVKDFRLNTQCSAGNGYFLQNTAENFGIAVDQYARAAFSASRCPEFSYGCGVFLQSDIVDFQRQGWRPEEILAGLACVLPKNIWLYVARIPNLPSLGSRFLLQGGTQRNLAAVKAQADFINARFAGSGTRPEVSVHPYCGEAGAIGAALEAREAWLPGGRSKFVGFDGLAALRYVALRDEETRCGLCSNSCPRTFIDVDRPQAVCASPAQPVPVAPIRVVAGHGCDKGLAEDVDGLRTIKEGLDEVMRRNPNLAAVSCRTAWRAIRPRPAAGGPIRDWFAGRRRSMRSAVRIGIPRALGQYQVNPLFSAYFEALGVRPRHLVYSDFTSERLYREGASRGSIDPCFPSKVALAHVHDLVHRKHRENPLDFVFFPMLDTLINELDEVQAACACPTLTLTPQTIRAAFNKESDVFAQLGIRYVSPLLNLDEPSLFERQLFDAMEGLLGLSWREHCIAVAAGYQALADYREGLRLRGSAVLTQLEREGRMGIVVLGRSYHADPGIHHDILDQLQARGYPILTQDTLPTDDVTLERIFGADVRAGRISSPKDIRDVWAHPYSASSSVKLWAAKFVARHPNLAALELSSFKCGHDAPIRSAIEEIVEATGTPFCSFRDLDENNPAGSIRLRIETIDYFLRRHAAAAFATRDAALGPAA
jgi:predicted CoA-substrate-specific enzyme activase